MDITTISTPTPVTNAVYAFSLTSCVGFFKCFLEFSLSLSNVLTLKPFLVFVTLVVSNTVS